MVNANEHNDGPGEASQPVGLNEDSRDGQVSDGQTEQVSGGRLGTDNVVQDQNSSEGEPGRSQSDSTGGQTEAETSDVVDPAESDSRV